MQPFEIDSADPVPTGPRTTSALKPRFLYRPVTAMLRRRPKRMATSRSKARASRTSVPRVRFWPALCARMSETVPPLEITEEGETG